MTTPEQQARAIAGDQHRPPDYWVLRCEPKLGFRKDVDMNAQDKAESLRLIELIEPETCAMTDDGSGDFIFCIDALRNIIELQDGEDMAARGAAQQRRALERIATIAHEGGLERLTEDEALCEIRRLTLDYWKRT